MALIDDIAAAKTALAAKEQELTAYFHDTKTMDSGSTNKALRLKTEIEAATAKLMYLENTLKLQN